MEESRLKTFIESKALVRNPLYPEQRRKCLIELGGVRIDEPMAALVKAMNDLPYCFTLQSCYGHFLHSGQKDRRNLNPLPAKAPLTTIKYRIAYIALCIENSVKGRALLAALSACADIDRRYVQFGSAEWFWQRQVNSYVLQVEPQPFRFQDTAILDYREALVVEKCRNELFPGLAKLITKPERSPASRTRGNTVNTAKKVPARAVGRSHGPKFTEGLLDHRHILNALAIRAGQTVLDAGCGNGYMSKIFAKQVGPKGTVYAVDADRSFIQALKEETQGANLQVIEGDITRPGDLKAASVDSVYISTVIHVFSAARLQGFIREVKRLLKPGGLLAIVEIEKTETSFGPPLHLRYAPEELKKAVAMVPVKTVSVAEHFYMQLFRKEEG